MSQLKFPPWSIGYYWQSALWLWVGMSSGCFTLGLTVSAITSRSILWHNDHSAGDERGRPLSKLSFAWTEYKGLLQGAPLQRLVFQLGRKVVLNLWLCVSFSVTWQFWTLIQLSLSLSEKFHSQNLKTWQGTQLSLCRLYAEMAEIWPQSHTDFCETLRPRVWTTTVWL